MAGPKRSETGLKPFETVGKTAISADPTFIWKLMAGPKRSETGLTPFETVGRQLYLLILHSSKEV